MKDAPHTTPSRLELEERRADARKLLEIEGNPLTPEDEAFFEKMDELGLTPDERIAYIKQQFLQTIPSK